MIADIHMHVIYNVDDGSDSIETSMAMLKKAYDSGVRIVFATSHGGAFLKMRRRIKTNGNFKKLKACCEVELPDLTLLKGAEIRIYPDEIKKMLKLIKSGKMPALGDSRCLLLEFNNYDISFEEIRDCCCEFMNNGYRPVIAHIERCHKVIPSIEKLVMLHDMGCLFQINMESILNETNKEAHARVMEILKEKLADFIGSDAHGMDFRSPHYEKEVEYLYADYEKEYIDKLLFENAKEYLI